MNGELEPIEVLRARIRRAIVEREVWETQRLAYRLNRAESLATMFDGLVVGAVVIIGLGALTSGYQSETEQVARNWLALTAVACWTVARALPRLTK